MSLLIFPQLPLLAFPVDQDFGNFDTNVQEAISGKATFYPNRIAPKRRYQIAYDGLDSQGNFVGVLVNSLQTLVGFYNQCYGRALIFGFWDVDDNAVSAQSFGTGDGSTTIFQLIRTQSGFAENVYAPLNPAAPFLIPNPLNPNLVASNLYAPNNFLANSATLSTQSKTLPAGNFVLSFKGTGSVVLSGAASGTLNGTGASNRVSLPFTSSGGSVTFTVSGSVTSAQCEQSTLMTPGPYFQTLATQYFGGPWITVSGALVDPSTYTIGTNNGQITFTVAPGAAAPLAWTGNFYWLCNFDEDKLSLSKIAYSLFSAKKIGFTTRLI